MKKLDKNETMHNTAQNNNIPFNFDTVTCNFTTLYNAFTKRFCSQHATVTNTKCYFDSFNFRIRIQATIEITDRINGKNTHKRIRAQTALSLTNISFTQQDITLRVKKKEQPDK